MAAAGDLPKAGESTKSSNKTTETKGDKSGTESAGDSLPERKGLPVDSSNSSSPTRLDDYRDKKSKEALDEAKKALVQAESDAEKTKARALAEADDVKKKALVAAQAMQIKALADAEKANQEAQNTKWLVYGGVILGIIIVLVIVIFMFSSKSEPVKEAEESNESDE